MPPLDSDVNTSPGHCPLSLPIRQLFEMSDICGSGSGGTCLNRGGVVFELSHSAACNHRDSHSFRNFSNQVKIIAFARPVTVKAL